LLAAAERRPGAEAPQVVLDLDGTLVDNRPRFLAILRSLEPAWRTRFAELAPRLAALREERVEYRVEETLAHVGITEPAAVTEAVLHWEASFFTERFLMEDRAMPGAVELVRALLRAGARVVYLTGRDVPNMGRGTIASLHALGFPLAEPGVELLMKPSPAMGDVAFKQGALARLGRLGPMAAFMDNDPAQCHAFLEQFPDKLCLLFDSTRPPHGPPLAPAVRVIRTLEPLVP
jgi:beta-phosphoglucomutase-like phosphatase (HAD superfamily)